MSGDNLQDLFVVFLGQVMIPLLIKEVIMIALKQNGFASGT